MWFPQGKKVFSLIKKTAETRVEVMSQEGVFLVLNEKWFCNLFLIPGLNALLLTSHV